MTFKLGGGVLGGEPIILKAVDQVSVDLREGQTIGIVGESGSGKSTLARALLRLLPSEGAIRFDGRDIANLERAEMRPLRKQLQIVFQDPFGSLSPRLTAGQIVTEGLLVHEPSSSARDRDLRAARAFDEVGLDPALRNRYPHEFSGGQRQRIAIARAIILKPRVVVLDEPTSALDRQVQKQIVELLRDLQKAHQLSYLFISHDLAVVRAMADHIMVMKDGRMVEQGTPERIFDDPHEDYTRRLMAAPSSITARCRRRNFALLTLSRNGRGRLLKYRNRRCRRRRCAAPATSRATASGNNRCRARCAGPGRACSESRIVDQEVDRQADGQIGAQRRIEGEEHELRRLAELHLGIGDAVEDGLAVFVLADLEDRACPSSPR